MLIIKKMKITGLGGISGTAEYTFGEGAFALVSGNGGGKSTAIDALRFALTGKATAEMINAACKEGTVELFLSNGTGVCVVKRTLSLTGTGRPSVTSWLNGKKTPAASVTRTILGKDVDNAVLITSGTLESAPEGPTGKILMSYMDASMAKEDALAMLLDDSLPDGVCAAINNWNIPDNIGMEEARMISKEAADRKKAARRAKQPIETFLKGKPIVSPAGNLKALTAECEAAREREAKSMAAMQIFDGWQKRKAAREKAVLELASLRGQIRCMESEMPASGAHTPQEIQELLIKNANEKASIQASITLIDDEIQRLLTLAKQLQSGICPLLAMVKQDNAKGQDPSEGQPVDVPVDDKEDAGENTFTRCRADLTPVLKSTKADGKAAYKKRKAAECRLAELSGEEQALGKSLKKAQELETLKAREAVLASSIGPEEPRPEGVDIPLARARQERMDTERKLNDARIFAETSDAREQLNTLETEEKASDIIASGFSQTGPICAALLNGYMGTLTEEAEESGRICGIHVRFLVKQGSRFSMEFDTGEGAGFRPYSQLSDGEKSLACIAVTDILSRICGHGIFIADNLEHMDDGNLNRAAELLMQMSDAYGTILLASTEHPGIADILTSQGITVVSPQLGRSEMVQEACDQAGTNKDDAPQPAGENNPEGVNLSGTDAQMQYDMAGMDIDRDMKTEEVTQRGAQEDVQVNPEQGSGLLAGMESGDSGVPWVPVGIGLSVDADAVSGISTEGQENVYGDNSCSPSLNFCPDDAVNFEPGVGVEENDALWDLWESDKSN